MSDNEKNEDVLKKLRDVRRKLQESLSEDGSVSKESEDLSKKVLIDGQADLEKQDKAKAIEAKSEELKKPKLYKAGEAQKLESPKKAKAAAAPKKLKAAAPVKVGLSAKKMAGIQKRIREKVATRQSMSNKRRAMLVIACFIAAMPLFAVSTLAMATCEFDLGGIGFSYEDTSMDELPNSRLNVLLPVYNPGIFPAVLGQVQLQLADLEGNVIGNVFTSTAKTILPRQSIMLALNLDLDKIQAGEWISGLFQDFELNVKVQGLSYNGLTIPGEIVVADLNLYDIIMDLVGGLDISSLLTDLIAPSNNIYTQIERRTGVDPLTGKTSDPWQLAKYKAGLTYQDKPFSSQDLGDMVLDIEETDSAFKLNTSTALDIPVIEGFNLGTLKIWNLDAGLYVDNTNISTSYDNETVANYQYPLLKLNSFPSDGTYMGKPKGDIHIRFGGEGEINALATINKDPITGDTHPSAELDWDDPQAVSDYIEDSRVNEPMFFFLYKLLKDGWLNGLLAINNLDIEIFGIKITGISIPRELLGVINVPLNIQGLLGGGLGNGIFGALGQFVTMVGTGGMSMLGSSSLVDLDAFTDSIEFGGDFDMDAIQESWGPTANLSLSLPLGLNKFPIDIHLGLEGAKIGLATIINDVEKNFAEVKVTSGASDIVYINGLGSNVTIDISLTLYKNETLAPYVAKFLRDLIERFTLDAVINLNVEKLILFAENLTIPKIALGLPLSLELGDMVGDLLGGLLDGALTPEAISGLLGGGGEEESINEVFSFSGNPLASVYEIPLSLIMNNPLINYIFSEEGQKWIESDSEALSASALPDCSQDFVFSVNKLVDRTSIDVIIQDMEMSGLLPITIGVGYAELSILSPNQYGDWERIIALKINNYFELKPEGEETSDIDISLQIFDTPTVCSMIHNFLNEGILSIKLQGSIDLNLSGVFLDDLKMELEMSDVDTGFNLSAVISVAIGGLGGMLEGVEIINAPSIAESEVEWWDGDLSKIPFVSQLGGLDGVMEIGDFKIYYIEESGWPDPHSGSVDIRVGVPLTNFLMELAITQLEAEIWAVKNEPASVMARISTPGVVLFPGDEAELVLDIKLIKSPYLEAFVQNTIATFGLSGYIVANISVNVFDCDIGPISLAGDDALDLGLLLPDITSLLEASIPIGAKTQTNGPLASQLDMDVIGKFALMYVTSPPGASDPHCGPQNWTQPMIDVRVGLGLMPNFNMSIVGGALQLLDANIYNAIYNPILDNVVEASHYSIMADASFTPGTIYFNNTYSNPADPSNYNVDPSKPYYNNNTDTLYYQPTVGAIPYNMSTYAQFELSLKVFNISFGTWETAYPRHLWRSLGGPYFPVRTFGREFGGYPDYRREYHPYFSPAYNILAGALNGFDMDNIDIGKILSNIKLNGTMTINIFSMDITLDVGSEVITSLMSSLMSGFSLALKEVIREVATPFGGYTPPLASFKDAETGAVNRMSKEPSLPTASAGMALDLAAFLIDYPLVGAWEKNSHLFCPQYGGWGGSNVNPNSVDYRAGLYDAEHPYASNIETFYKDHDYETFKVFMENFRKSRGMNYNPFFEVYDENGAYIEDPEQWALKWYGMSGRTRTTVLEFIIAIAPRISLGVLSGFLTLWMENPGQPCDIAPFGYVYINESVFVPTVPESAMPGGEWTDWRIPGVVGDPNSNGYWVDETGKPNPNWYWLALNIRAFEGPLFQGFLYQLMNGFNIRFIAFGTVNASLFGYDVYGVSFGNLGMGEPGDFNQRCLDYQAQFGGGGQVWGNPSLNGTQIYTEEPEDDFPPEEFIPSYADVEMSFFDLTSVLDGLTDQIVDILLDTLTSGGIKEISMDGIRIVTPEITIAAIMPLPAWLIDIFIGIKRATVDVPDWTTLPEQYWADVGLIRSEQMIELENYPGSQGDPYDFWYNNLVSVSLEDTWTIKPIEIFLDFDALQGINVLNLLLALIGIGSMDDAFSMDHMWLTINPLIPHIGIPYEFDYVYSLSVDQGDLTFDLREMIGGLL